jgi:hypothetical protein
LSISFLSVFSICFQHTVISVSNKEQRCFRVQRFSGTELKMDKAQVYKFLAARGEHAIPHGAYVITRLVYASALHKWHYLQALPNISQRTKSAFHYSFWQMNTIVMGFLFILGKIAIILSYSQYPSSSIKAPMDLCYRIACRNTVGCYLQALRNILAENELCRVILPVLSH